MSAVGGELGAGVGVGGALGSSSGGRRGGPHPEPRRIAIVEDHVMVRDGLVATAEAVAGVTVVLATDAVADVMALEPPPDLVLLDMELNRRHVTPEEVSEIIAAGSRVLIVSALASPDLVRRMTGLGIGGLVPKRECDGELLAEAITEVLADGYWTTPALAAILSNDTRLERPELSERERRALVLYASGLKLASVGRRMGVSANTAKTYISRVRAKYSAAGLNVGTKLGLCRAAVDEGLLPDPRGDQ